MIEETSSSIYEKLAAQNADELDYLDFLIGANKYDTFDDGTILYYDFLTMLTEQFPNEFTATEMHQLANIAFSLAPANQTKKTIEMNKKEREREMVN